MNPPCVFVDGIRSLGAHNNVVRLQSIQSKPDGKPHPELHLLIPGGIVKQTVEALAETIWWTGNSLMYDAFFAELKNTGTAAAFRSTIRQGRVVGLASAAARLGGQEDCRATKLSLRLAGLPE